MKKHFLSFLLSLHCLFVVAQTDEGIAKFSEEKRNQWIKKKTTELIKIKPETILQKAMLQENEHTDGIILSVEINGKNILHTKDGGWIYFEAHSAHDNSKVGDITIAIDNKKRIFINEGHVCGGYIYFDAMHFKEIPSADSFFKHFNYNSENGNWKQVNKMKSNISFID